jgi:hypothetical protein
MNGEAHVSRKRCADFRFNLLAQIMRLLHNEASMDEHVKSTNRVLPAGRESNSTAISPRMAALKLISDATACEKIVTEPVITKA